jgi:hypothetical protein
LLLDPLIFVLTGIFVWFPSQLLFLATRAHPPRFLPGLGQADDEDLLCRFRVMDWTRLILPKPTYLQCNHVRRSIFPSVRIPAVSIFVFYLKSELLSYPISGMAPEAVRPDLHQSAGTDTSGGQIRTALKSLKDGMPLVMFPPRRTHIRMERSKHFMPGAFFPGNRAQWT